MEEVRLRRVARAEEDAPVPEVLPVLVSCSGVPNDGVSDEEVPDAVPLQISQLLFFFLLKSARFSRNLSSW